MEFLNYMRGRGVFTNDRELLGKLSRCAYRTLFLLYQGTLEQEDVAPEVIISIQTFGDLINFHPHLHAIVSEGCFGAGGVFSRGMSFAGDYLRPHL